MQIPPESPCIYKNLATGNRCPYWTRVIDYTYLFPKINCQYNYFMEAFCVNSYREMTPPQATA